MRSSSCANFPVSEQNVTNNAAVFPVKLSFHCHLHKKLKTVKFFNQTKLKEVHLLECKHISRLYAAKETAPEELKLASDHFVATVSFHHFMMAYCSKGFFYSLVTGSRFISNDKAWSGQVV